jgi:hypothetical protein
MLDDFFLQNVEASSNLPWIISQNEEHKIWVILLVIIYFIDVLLKQNILKFTELIYRQ